MATGSPEFLKYAVTHKIMELAKLQRERAVDAVYEALRQAIVSSLMKPGERLNVEDLALKLGVSLTPVRGAIQHCRRKDWWRSVPRSGTFVANLTVQDVEETFKNSLRPGVPRGRGGNFEHLRTGTCPPPRIASAAAEAGEERRGPGSP